MSPDSQTSEVVCDPLASLPLPSDILCVKSYQQLLPDKRNAAKRETEPKSNLAEDHCVQVWKSLYYIAGSASGQDESNPAL